MGIIQKQHAGGGMTQTIAGQPSVSVKGEFVELYAEIDLLVLAVHCPYGDQSGPPMDVDYYPIELEVYDTGVAPQPSPRWHDWRPAWQAKMDRLKAEGDAGPRERNFGT